MPQQRIVLASSSPYRRAALQRLGLAAESISPEVDETPLPGESAAALARRLSLAKAQAVASIVPPDVIVIGADQSGELEGTIIGKPGSADAACAQLERASGRELLFHSGLAVCRGTTVDLTVTLTRVLMRPLDGDTIARYVARDQPLDCAGSFKCESLGIALFARCESNDPSALYGLPMIALTTALGGLGVAII